MSDVRIGFVTAVKLGLDCLNAIENLGGSLDLIITLTDDVAKNKSGRVSLDEFCKRNFVKLHKTKNINTPETLLEIQAANLDYLLVIGWSQLICPEIFTLVKKKLLGMHPTLLPKGRGRAPIPWTILKGLSVSGVTLFELMPDVDCGDIIAREAFPIAPNETASTLYKKACDAHVRLIEREWKNIRQGKIAGIPQDETQATYWARRYPEDGEITYKLSLEQIEKLVRASTRPYPGAFILNERGKLIIWSGKILKISNSSFKLPLLMRGSMIYEPTEYEWVL